MKPTAKLVRASAGSREALVLLGKSHRTCAAFFPETVQSSLETVAHTEFDTYKHQPRPAALPKFLAAQNYKYIVLTYTSRS